VTLRDAVAAMVERDGRRAIVRDDRGEYHAGAVVFEADVEEQREAAHLAGVDLVAYLIGCAEE